MRMEELTYRIWKGLSPVSLILLSVVLLLAACSDDGFEEGQEPSPNPNTRKQTVTLYAGAPSFIEVDRMPTRGLPYGYVPYYSLFPTTHPDNASIGIVLATATNYDQTNYFATQEKKDDGSGARSWKAVLDVQNNTPYYIYGFMPREEAGRATITFLEGSSSYSDGCRFTINNLNTLTSQDVCALVSVDKSMEAHNIEDMDIDLGKFGYSAEYPYLYLLLKHLYAGLHFKAHIDMEYAKLRTIKVKSMTLTTVENISDKINLSFNVTANTTGADPIGSLDYEDVYTSVSEKHTATVQLFPPLVGSETTAPSEFELQTTTTDDFLSCFAPGKCGSFDLKTTYDVYDKKGNLIRANCEAVNRIESTTVLNVNNLNAGDIYTIDLKVQPTYLYVLSDPDLDNPTFTVITGS